MNPDEQEAIMRHNHAIIRQRLVEIKGKLPDLAEGEELIITMPFGTVSDGTVQFPASKIDKILQILRDVELDKPYDPTVHGDDDEIVIAGDERP